MKVKSVLLDAGGIDRALNRVAEEILERNLGAGDLVLIGIRTQGIHIARRLSAKLEKIGGEPVPVGVMDVTLYRDDLGRGRSGPLVGKTEIDFAIDGKKVVLVDDVLFTGRTARAALDGLIYLGRPTRVQMAVLVDRGRAGRELPIHADFIGREERTVGNEHIEVYLTEKDGMDQVVLMEKDPSRREGP